MHNNHLALTRREALAAGSASALAFILPGCAATTARPVTAAPASAAALLDEFAWRFLAHEPETATQKGVDCGAHADLHGKLEDRSAAGQAAIAQSLRADLARAEAVDLAPLDLATRTSFEVVRSAYRSALGGFALPYGDVAVGSWRNTPYVVIQNVGQYIDAPNVLEADHPVREAADAEAYIARLEVLPATLDGETGRIRAARAIGLVPPAILLDRTIAQLGKAIEDARGGGRLVEALTSRTGAIPGEWDRRARDRQRCRRRSARTPARRNPRPTRGRARCAGALGTPAR